MKQLSKTNVKIPLVTTFLEDDVYETRLTDKFMENVICNEDHYYHRTAQVLSKKQFEPTVYYMSQEKQMKKFTHKYGHTIIRVPAIRMPFIHEPIVYAPKMIELIQDYDICHFVSGYYVHYKVPDPFDYMVSKLHKKIPLVAMWAGGKHEWLFPIRRSIKKWALQRCSKFLVSSTDEINTLETIFDIPKEKISHLISPHDFSIFKKRDKKFAAEKISMNPDFRYLISVGRLTHRKGIESLLDVFYELGKKYDDLKLIIVGDGPLMEYITNFRKKHLLEEKIILTGRLPHEILCYYYNISTALLHIPKGAGVGGVIIEASASGLPVIATTGAGSTHEYVNEKNKNGILIHYDNNTEIKNAIITILENEKFYRNFNTNFLNEFSYDEFGKTLSNIYYELLQ